MGTVVLANLSFNRDVFLADGGNYVVTYGNKKYHIFTGNGGLTVYAGSKQVELLMIGGGGSGGGRIGGGGGAGGLVNTSLEITPGIIPTVIGGGASPAYQYGATGCRGNNGGDSSFGITVAYGGGGGGDYSGISGTNGGCGGGAGGYSAGTQSNGSQGYNGGSTAGSNAGGGGGIGGNGTPGYANDGEPGGPGGPGRNFSDWFNDIVAGGGPSLGVDGGYIGGGGAGTSAWIIGGATVPGGIGGGGHGSCRDCGNGSALDGVANTGGGGGGSRNVYDAYGPFVSGAGGSGLVIVRYNVL